MCETSPFTQRLQIQIDVTWWCHDGDVCVSNMFPGCPPVNLNMNLLTVYNQWDAVIMCSDGDPDPPNNLKSGSYVFHSKLHNYINTISKQEAVWLCHCRRADCRCDNSNYNNTNTRWVKVFCQWQMLFFGQKCDEESGGQTGQTLLHV